MTTFSIRNYNCKDEELPVISKFTSFSLKRDLADFASYSPRFNEAYVNSYDSKITEVTELVEPKSETVQLKTITERLYSNMNGLINPINRLTGYVNLAHESLHISPADFGLTLLRKGINSKDAESVIKNLRTVNTNLTRYTEILSAQGLQPEFSALFVDAEVSISTDKQNQYEIISNRKAVVQNNVGVLNSLFEQLTEIQTIGKILYKDNDAVKLQEYTFSELKKRVRKTSSPANGKPEGNRDVPNSSEN
jgi:hypothetical protein